MEIKEILALVLFAVLTASNIVAFDLFGKLRKELEELRENFERLQAIEETHDGYISSLSLKVCDANVAIENLRAQFENELSGEIEAVTDKARKEAEAQQSFIDGLRNILDFDGGAFGKGEK